MVQSLVSTKVNKKICLLRAYLILNKKMLSPLVPSLSLVLRGIATSAKCDINCHRASIARIGRLTYSRTYPVVLVQSDGSTINIRYHEPRKIVKLPLDLTTLTEAERKKRIEARKPRVKVVIEDDIEDDFKVTNYEHLWKK